MGSPQAAHLGANTLWGEQRSVRHRLCFWRARPRVPRSPPPSPALPPPALDRGLGSLTGTRFLMLLRDPSPALTSTSGPSLYSEQRLTVCFLPWRSLVQAQAHRGWRPAEPEPSKLAKLEPQGLEDVTWGFWCFVLFCFPGNLIL